MKSGESNQNEAKRSKTKKTEVQYANHLTQGMNREPSCKAPRYYRIYECVFAKTDRETTSTVQSTSVFLGNSNALKILKKEGIQVFVDFTRSELEVKILPTQLGARLKLPRSATQT